MLIHMEGEKFQRLIRWKQDSHCIICGHYPCEVLALMRPQGNQSNVKAQDMLNLCEAHFNEGKMIGVHGLAVIYPPVYQWLKDNEQWEVIFEVKRFGIEEGEF